jgi:hypothetical protein
MKIIDLSDGRYYIIRCSDWSVVIQADDEVEACTQALKEMLEKYDRDLKLSSVIISEELKADSEESEFDDLVSYHSVSRMLANAGLHDLSSNVKMVFGA